MNYSWLQNLFNLKKIFDKYLPMIREAHALVMNHKEYFEMVNSKIAELRREIKALKEKDAGEVIDVTEVTEEPKEDDNAVA